MLRRIVVLSVLLMVVLAPAALAANVKIRVEGKTTTIFGATQPTVTADNALQALDVASFAGEFYYGNDDVSSATTSARSASTPPISRRAGCSRSTGSRRRSAPTRPC